MNFPLHLLFVVVGVLAVSGYAEIDSKQIKPDIGQLKTDKLDLHSTVQEDLVTGITKIETDFDYVCAKGQDKAASLVNNDKALDAAFTKMQQTPPQGECREAWKELLNVCLTGDKAEAIALEKQRRAICQPKEEVDYSKKNPYGADGEVADEAAVKAVPRVDESIEKMLSNLSGQSNAEAQTKTGQQNVNFGGMSSSSMCGEAESSVTRTHTWMEGTLSIIAYYTTERCAVTGDTFYRMHGWEVDETGKRSSWDNGWLDKKSDLMKELDSEPVRKEDDDYYSVYEKAG